MAPLSSLLRSRRPLSRAALVPAFAMLSATLAASPAQARNLMTADGPGGTYELLRQAYTTELPDCGHMVDHITEDFDAELNKNVFVFHAHVNQDDDRCGGTDRQRTEIRARAADIIANNGETVYYRWKFKLATGFQGSPSFTHIFQIKSDLGAPILTLTPRVSTFEMTGRGAGNSGDTELAKFIGHWVVVDLKVLYSDNGRVEITIRKLSDGTMLYAHSGGADMWDANASAHDSKFGIYRSLNNRGMLRDEQVRFADFCASKVSAAECADGALPPPPDGGVGMPDAGGAADGGSAPDAGSGAGGASGSGGAGPGGTGGAGPGGTGGAAGSSGGSGGAGGASPPRDAGARDTRPPGEPPSSADPNEGGCSCSLGDGNGAGGQGAAWLLLLGLGLALVKHRRRRVQGPR